MNLMDLMTKTASQHREFKAVVECNLDQQLQQYFIHNSSQVNTEYEACTKVLEALLTDSIGSLVETWLDNGSWEMKAEPEISTATSFVQEKL